MRAAFITMATVVAGIALTCTLRGDPLLVQEETVCVTAGVPDPAPVYRRATDLDAGLAPNTVVQRILNQNCRACHGEVRRYGAPAHFDLSCYDARRCSSDGGLVRGAADMAFGICVSAVQALPDSPLRMPFHPLRKPLCDSDRETLRRWINADAPAEVYAPPAPNMPEACAPRDALPCVTTRGGGSLPERPSYAAHVQPILSARCNACHFQPSYFEASPQRHFGLFFETSEQHGSERGVGVYEYRGEVARTAAERVPHGPFQFIDPMPYDPPYGGARVPLVPPLCDADRAVLARWAEQGRRTGSSVDLPRECVTETVATRPTWNRDVGRIFGARCGLCHGERDRSGQRLRLDLFTRDPERDGGVAGGPGLTDRLFVCRNVLDGVLQRDVTLPIETGDCAGSTSGRKLRTQQLIDLVELVTLTTTAYMPYGSAVRLPDGGTLRAPLCDTDKETIRRWRATGMPLD